MRATLEKDICEIERSPPGAGRWQQTKALGRKVRVSIHPAKPEKAVVQMPMVGLPIGRLPEEERAGANNRRTRGL